MLSAAAIDRLVWLGSLWILLAAAWMAFCVWVDSDAPEILGDDVSWSLYFVLAGAAWFFLTYAYGFGLLPLFLLAFPASFLGYVAYRDRQAPSTRTILSERFARKMVFAAASKLGMERTVQKWFSERHGAPGDLSLIHI